MLPLLLDSILFRVILTLLVKLQPFLTSAADLLCSLLFKLHLGGWSGGAWRGEDLLDYCSRCFRVGRYRGIVRRLVAGGVIQARLRFPLQLLLIEEVRVVLTAARRILLLSAARLPRARAGRGERLELVTTRRVH